MKIYIITGESSGDQHASQIAKQLFIQDKKIQIKAWGGKNENIGKAQQAFYKRAKLNSLATMGNYFVDMES